MTMKYISTPGTMLTTKQVIDKFLAITKTTLEELRSKSQKQHLVQNRQILMWLLRTNNNSMPYRSIGDTVNRDHSTAVISYQKIENWISIGDHLGKTAQLIHQQITKQ